MRRKPMKPHAPSLEPLEDRVALSANLALTKLGSFQTSNTFDRGAAEISAYDPASERLFVINGADRTVDVLSLSDPANITRVGRIDVTPFGGIANSVAARDGVLAVAVEAAVKTDPGRVVFFTAGGALLNSVTVGALPDMLTFSPDGRNVLVANEGEPNSYGQLDSVNPEGSVRIIDPARTGTTTS